MTDNSKYTFSQKSLQITMELIKTFAYVLRASMLLFDSNDVEYIGFVPLVGLQCTFQVHIPFTRTNCFRHTCPRSLTSFPDIKHSSPSYAQYMSDVLTTTNTSETTMLITWPTTVSSTFSTFLI